MTLHRSAEVLLVHEHVRAENYLIFLRQESPLHEAITCFETQVDLRLEDEVLLDQTVHHRRVKLVLLEVCEVTPHLMLRPSRILIKH